METLKFWVDFMVYLTFCKIVFFGGEFGFYYWFRYGSHYWNWYRSRESYIEARMWIKVIELQLDDKKVKGAE